MIRLVLQKAVDGGEGRIAAVGLEQHKRAEKVDHRQLRIEATCGLQVGDGARPLATAAVKVGPAHVERDVVRVLGDLPRHHVDLLAGVFVGEGRAGEEEKGRGDANDKRAPGELSRPRVSADEDAPPVADLAVIQATSDEGGRLRFFDVPPGVYEAQLLDARGTSYAVTGDCFQLTLAGVTSRFI